MKMLEYIISDTITQIHSRKSQPCNSVTAIWQSPSGVGLCKMNSAVSTGSILL